MPKLLDYLKEKGLSHEEVIKLLEERNSKPDEGTDVPEEPEGEPDEIDKPDSNQDELDKETQDLVKKLADEEEAKLEKEAEAEKARLAKLVQEELKRRGKIVRKTPSKGKINDDKSIEYGISNNGFEVKTIRKKD